MKIVKLGKQEIAKEDFENKLGIKIKEWVKPEDDNFLKIYTQTGYIIYLRCEDMKVLFNLNIIVLVIWVAFLAFIAFRFFCGAWASSQNKFLSKVSLWVKDISFKSLQAQT